MRIIKFRVWDKEEKKWVLTESGGQSLNPKTDELEYTYSNTFTLQDWETLRMIGAFPADYEVVEFTGLKDKNGKEIWEGDIVRIFIKNFLPKIGYVSYVFSRYICCYEKEMRNYSLEPGDYKDIEVIGNIYENPKLLK